MAVTTLGIDLAKSIFQVPGVEAHGEVALPKRLCQNSPQQEEMLQERY
jgi:hypothetical protein